MDRNHDLYMLQSKLSDSPKNDQSELIKSYDFLQYGTILQLFLFTNLWTLLLTVVPVLISIPSNEYYRGHPNWYTGNDIIRLIEPIGGLPLNFYIFWNSNILSKRYKTQLDYIIIFLFFFGAAIYQQGAGFHSASNMYQNAVSQILDNTTKNDDTINLLSDLYYWMRTIWEHNISHYLYASGYAIMSFCHAFAYQYHTVYLPSLIISVDISPTSDSILYEEYTNRYYYIGKMNQRIWILLYITSFTFALLVASVAIEFPEGLIVGLLYTCLYGICGIGAAIFSQYHIDGSRMDEFGNIIGSPSLVAKLKDYFLRFIFTRPILHYFLVSYIEAMIIILIWIISVGGLKQRNQVF